MRELKPLPRSDGRYLIGDDGSVWRSLSNGDTRQLRGSFDKDGYVIVNIRLGKAPKRKLKIHRLVLEAFVGPPADGQQACHHNGIKHDNRASNLRWGSALDNTADKIRHGTVPRGENTALAKLKIKDVIAIRARLSAGESGSSLAREFGVLKTTISNIRLGLSWAHVGPPLPRAQRRNLDRERRIIELRASGCSPSEISRLSMIPLSSVRLVLKRGPCSATRTACLNGKSPHVNPLDEPPPKKSHHKKKS